MKALAILVTILLAALGAAQNAQITSMLTTGSDREAAYTYPYWSRVGVDGMGSCAFVSVVRLTKADAQFHMISPFGVQRTTPFSFYSQGYAHTQTTGVVGLPGGGFVVSGHAFNAASVGLPFLAYFNAAGDLAWSKLFTDLPPAPNYFAAQSYAFPGPSNTITYVANDDLNHRAFLYRFSLTGTQVGIRGFLFNLPGPNARMDIRPVGDDFLVLFYSATVPGGYDYEVSMWTFAGVRKCRYVLRLPEVPMTFLAERFGSSTYFTLGIDSPNYYYKLGRIDAEGNLRWFIGSPSGDAQFPRLLESVNNRLYLSVERYSPSGVTLSSVSSFGSLAFVTSGIYSTHVDTGGPVNSSLYGYDWAGAFRFAVPSPPVATDSARLTNGAWAGFSDDFATSPRVWRVEQAPVAKPDNQYNTKIQTAYTPSSGAGVLANDLFATDLVPTLVTTTPNGSLVFRTDGTFTYTPNAGFVGTDSFTYRLTRLGMPATAAASITVRRPGDVYPFSTTNPTFLPNGSTVSLNLQIERATTAGSISVSDNHPNVTVPSTVSYAANATTVAIPVTAAPTTSGGAVTVTASSGTFTSTWSLPLEKVAFSGNIVIPSTTLRVGGTSTGTITIDRNAPEAIGVSMATDAPYLVSIPSVVTIPTGSRTATFSMSLVSLPTAATVVQVVGRRGTISVSGVLNIGP